MAITTAAKKAVKTSARRRVFNDRRRRAMKKSIKSIEKLVRDEKISEAKELLPTAYKAIDKAAGRGIIKKNTAARKKARVSRITKPAQ